MPPPVLDITLYPLRDGIHWGATVKWSENEAPHMMKLRGASSRELMLAAVGRLFDRRSDATLEADAESPR